MKVASVLLYMLKPPSLLTQRFKENEDSQEKISIICVTLVNGQSEGE